ncbi:MarR family transcriptional regulator [uncultured Hyphomonas sp.]|uniref:MarR family winged helix-turn-helix transcriptional regulator n=1 Tax=uncultured Hyphomonas sp. TaxID=225298 RepID=UPI002AAB9EC7|nr:MarR family transcriptional regulator [uncultured Hyphomonas sp.]
MNRPAGLAGDPVEFAAMTEISIIAHLADTAFARRLPDGLTTAQFAVLNHLLRLDTQQTIGELARALQVSQPTMSSTVRRLEEKGFVALVPDPDDRRIRRISVTPAGATTRNLAVQALDATKNELAALSQKEWQQILPLLYKLRVALDSAR